MSWHLHPSALQRPTVLVVGEALIDVVTHYDGHIDVCVGGSPANVARGLGRLGLPTHLLTAIAADRDGLHIADDLARSGVTVLGESFTLVKTPTAVARIDVDGQPRYEFEVEWDLPDRSLKRVPDVLHVGSYSAFRQPGSEQVLQLIQRATEGGARVTFDPNIRPALLPAHADVVARFEHIARRTSIVKLSDEDARWLYPHLQAETVLDHLVSMGVPLAVVTLGPRGAILATDNARATIPALHNVRVIDTIGAGDSFMAALIFLTSSLPDRPFTEFDLELIGRKCTEAAGITISRKGSDPPTTQELALH